MLEHVLRHVKVDTFVGERQLLEVLTSESTDHGARRFLLEKLAGYVVRAYRRKELARAAIDRGGFVDGQRAPIGKPLPKNRHERTLSRNTAAASAIVVVPQPGVARYEGRAPMANRTMSAILEHRRPESSFEPSGKLLAFAQDAPRPATGCGSAQGDLPLRVVWNAQSRILPVCVLDAR